MATQTKEQTTVDCAVLAHNFDMAAYQVDQAAIDTHTARNMMIASLEACVKAGYKTVQSGLFCKNGKAGKPKEGEFPYLVAKTEFETNYLAHHKAKWDGKGEYTPPTKKELDNTIKQKIATLAFFLEVGKYTSNVGRDKPKIMHEVYSAEYDALVKKRQEQEEKTKAVQKIAAASLENAKTMQAAVILEQQNRGKNPPAEVTKTVQNLANEANKQAQVDIESESKAAEILARLEQLEASKKAQLDAAKTKIVNKSKLAGSAATATTGEVDHSASTKISAQAGISKDNMARARVLYDGLRLVEDASTLKALHDIIRMELIL